MSSKRKHDEGGSESDGEGKTRNRGEMKDRQRQWQTVGDSDDGSGSSSSSSDSDSDDGSSEQRRREKKARREDREDREDKGGREGKERKEKKEDRRDEKKEKKEKKEHKHSSSKHKKKDKDKDMDRERKRDKDKKKDKRKDKKKDRDRDRDRERGDKSSSAQGPSMSVNQNEYGRYGVIREVDFFNKQREFEAYMTEVKGVPGVLSESKRDVAQHFKGFVEDYNTATMPNDKYYNYERWEMQEYAREQQRKQNQQVRDDSSELPQSFNDVAIRREELRRLKDQEEQKEFMALKNKLEGKKDVLGNMRRQAQLSTELQLAFKRGDSATVKRLERILAPEENKMVAAHPWAK
jgi:hypothetical protein